MMTLQEAIAKATKLIKLSESGDTHEAALAAERAQEILARYNIDAAALSVDGAVTEIDEEIENFTSRAPLDAGGTRLATWKLRLASVVATANACKAYGTGGAIGIIGRASDVEKVRYLYAMLLREIDRLTNINGKGCGMVYRTEYRHGAIQAIGDKLKAAHTKVAADMRAENSGAALVRIDNALAKIEAKSASVDQWVRRNMRFTKSRSVRQSNPSAREAGYAAGQNINVSGARGSLGAAKRQIA